MVDDTPARLGNFLYLLGELERALELGGIEWTAPTAVSARKRLITIFSEVAAIAARLEGAG
jgi:hypothetical protein